LYLFCGETRVSATFFQGGQKCKWQGVAKSFEDAPAQIEAAKAVLARLGDPRQERATQAGIASGRQTLESTASKALITIAQLEEIRKIQEAGLQAYATLEADISENQRLLEQHQAAHERYLANQKIAASHSTRKAVLEGLQAELAIKQGERNERDRQCQDAAKLYDVQAHARAKDEAAAARDGVARMSAQLDGYNTQFQQRNDELAVLRETEEQLCIKQAERDELDHLITTFKSVREGIKSAGSLVTKRRVERISELANSIFQDFMKDDTGREKPLSIRWDEEDYGIIARECGQTIERTFRQLSGGEQMSAALAVRLAILRVMSDLHILFLDEPTANLDSKRRSKLAERIANIGNLKQIFVITHDDTFEPETSTVIQVSKENGVSQIKVGR
jgi:exonuclease SbcC